MPHDVTLVQALPPLAFLAFSVAFAGLYLAGVSRAAAGLFALAYLLGAGAFALDMMPKEQSGLVDRLVLNSLYTFVSAFTVYAIFVRYERRPPRLLITAIAAATMLIYVAARLAADSALLNAFVVNTGNGLLMLVAFPALGGRLRGVIDQLLAVVYAIYIAQFFFRPVLTFLLLDGAAKGVPQHAAYIAGLQIVVGAFAVLLGALQWLSMALAPRQAAARVEEGAAASGEQSWAAFEAEANVYFRSGDFLAETPVLIIADIDGLRRIAQTQGPEAAARAVASLEALVRDAAVEKRLAARMDDGVFALILRAESVAEALRVAEGVRAAFAKTGARASFGVAVRMRGEALADLIERADAALYVAKSDGGDAVACDTDAKVAGLREALNLLGRRRYGVSARKVA